MREVIKISLVLVFFHVAVLGNMGAPLAEEQKDIKFHTYEGRISYINWVTSEMTVNGVGSRKFYVPKEVVITKLGNIITFADLNILDNVIVIYYEELSGKNIVIKINVVIV